MLVSASSSEAGGGRGTCAATCYEGDDAIDPEEAFDVDGRCCRHGAMWEGCFYLVFLVLWTFLWLVSLCSDNFANQDFEISQEVRWTERKDKKWGEMGDACPLYTSYLGKNTSVTGCPASGLFFPIQNDGVDEEMERVFKERSRGEAPQAMCEVGSSLGEGAISLSWPLSFPSFLSTWTLLLLP